MLRSLYSAVSGLKNHQLRMDVIGNNIANVNTIGFKSSDVIFKDVYSQTLQPASVAVNLRGGVNPMQVGLGMSAAAITVNFSGLTSAMRTETPLDVCISGNGFFTVKRAGDATEEPIYTRVGNFYFDAAGYLVTSEGYKVMGAVDNGGTTELEQIKIDDADLDMVKRAIIKDTGEIEILKGDDTVVSLGYLAVSTFTNTNGLEKIGDSYWSQTANSGPAAFDVPGGENGAGFLNTGALEMSNVDLAREFTNMIITQRGFQANSRVITTSDQMLEELVNMKR